MHWVCLTLYHSLTHCDADCSVWIMMNSIPYDVDLNYTHTHLRDINVCAHVPGLAWPVVCLLLALYTCAYVGISYSRIVKKWKAWQDINKWEKTKRKARRDVKADTGKWNAEVHAYTIAIDVAGHATPEHTTTVLAVSQFKSLLLFFVLKQFIYNCIYTRLYYYYYNSDVVNIYTIHIVSYTPAGRTYTDTHIIDSY